MLMTVRLPLRSSTTCDALFDSAASAPETKKPQNADASIVVAASDSAETSASFRERPRRAKRTGEGAGEQSDEGTGGWRMTAPMEGFAIVSSIEVGEAPFH